MSAPFVMLATPTNVFVWRGFWLDYTALILHSAPHLNLTVFPPDGTYIADQREAIVRRARECGCSHILWLDSDMRFPKDTLLRLLKIGGDVAAAGYVTRREPHYPTTWGGMGTDRPLPLYGGTEADAVGMGVMLTRTSVFAAVEEPWFDLGYTRHPSTGRWFFEGEDMAFCRKLYARGFHLFIDPILTREVRHIGVKEYGMEDADLMGAAPTTHVPWPRA